MRTHTTKTKKALQGYAGMAAALLAVSASGSTEVQGQINHIDIDPDVSMVQDHYDLDLNGDGIVDFTLHNVYGSTFSNLNSIRPVGSNAIAGFTSLGGPFGSSPYSLASRLDYGDVINGDLDWKNENLYFNFKSVSEPFIGDWDDETGIAALRFNVGGATHYGFVRVEANTGFISGSMTVFNYSWNDNPGGPIVATDFGLCEAPTGLTATQITPTKFELSWDQVSVINKYQLFYRKAGDPSSLVKKLTPYNSRVIGGLDPATNYQWTVRVRCPENETSAIAGAFSFTTSAPRAANESSTTKQKYKVGTVVPIDAKED